MRSGNGSRQAHSSSLIKPRIKTPSPKATLNLEGSVWSRGGSAAVREVRDHIEA